MMIITVIQSDSCKEKETMKMKKRMMKMAAMMMAMTMVMGSAMTVHASDDGCVRDDGVGYGDSGLSCDIESGSSGDSGSSSSSESSSAPSESYDGGSSSYDDGCARDEGVGYGDSGLNCEIENGSGSSTSYSAPARRAPGSNTGVTGKEQFRALAKSGEGSYKVTHKGQTIATFWLVDTEGKSVPCTAVALKQRADGEWAINFEVADATGLTIGAPVDRTYMYTVLGVSYVTIGDDNIVIDMKAEAAQQ